MSDGMRILNLKIHNFVSYRGTHEFDFGAVDGKNGYFISGENGRGKTAITDAINWCLYGEVTAYLLSDERYFQEKRPIINSADYSDEGSALNFNASLLTNYAYWASDYEMWVQLTFHHEGRHYVLRRDSNPKLDITPQDDSHLDVKPSLSIDGKVVDQEKVGSEISSIMPLYTFS